MCPLFFSTAAAFCPPQDAFAIAAAGFVLSQSFGKSAWTAVDVALRRRDRRTTSTPRAGFPVLLLVRPLEKPVADVPELQVELVVDVPRFPDLLDDGGDVAFHAVLGADQ